MTVDHTTSIVGRFYGLLEGVEDADLAAVVADDLEFELMVPPAGDAPPERILGGRRDLEQLVDVLRARASAAPDGAAASHHEIDTLVHANGFELAVGRVVSGSQSGTFVAAAQSDDDGKVRRFASVVSSAVHFSPVEQRVPPPADLLARYFDRVDAISLEESLDVLADEFNFEMVFPGFDGEPDERVLRDKSDFQRFQASIRARRPRPTTPIAPKDRRHHTLVTTVADGLVIVVAEARNGRRNGPLITAAESDGGGRMLRYIIGMAPTVHFVESRRNS